MLLFKKMAISVFGIHILYMVRILLSYFAIYTKILVRNVSFSQITWVEGIGVVGWVSSKSECSVSTVVLNLFHKFSQVVLIIIF